MTEYVDLRFNLRSLPIDSLEIAERFGLDHNGVSHEIQGFDSLNTAGQKEMTFCKSGYKNRLDEVNSGAVITTAPYDSTELSILYSDNPKADFIEITRSLFLEQRARRIHPSTVISEDAKIGDNCLIGPNVIIGEGVKIESDCVIGPGTTIGQPGFGYQPTSDSTPENMYHSGEILIEEGVHIGANCTVDRAVNDCTRIGRNTKVHHMVHVAHNARVGRNNRINQFTSISGSVVTGKDVRIHPHAVISSHITIGSGATVGANSMVLDDVNENTLVVGSPAKTP